MNTIAGHAATRRQENRGTIISAATSEPDDEPDDAAGELRRRLAAELGLEAADGAQGEPPEDPADHVADPGAEEDEQERAARAVGRVRRAELAAGGREQGDEDQADALDQTTAQRRSCEAPLSLMAVRPDTHPASGASKRGRADPYRRVIGAWGIGLRTSRMRGGAAVRPGRPSWRRGRRRARRRS